MSDASRKKGCQNKPKASGGNGYQQETDQPFMPCPGFNGVDFIRDANERPGQDGGSRVDGHLDVNSFDQAGTNGWHMK